MHTLISKVLSMHRAWALCFWALLLAVTVLMLVPRPPPRIDTGWDKANHLLAFAAPMFAALVAWTRSNSTRAQAGWLAAGLWAWGGVIELLQGLMPPRSADWRDWLADGLGVLLGLTLFRALQAWRGLSRM